MVPQPVTSPADELGLLLPLADGEDDTPDPTDTTRTVRTPVAATAEAADLKSPW